MPANNGVPADWFLGEFNKMRHQIGQIATQSQYFFSDPQGNLRVKLGLLQNGDYGILLTDLDGNMQELLPGVDAYHNGTLSTTSTTPVALTGSPTVTCDIAASGDCEVTVGAFIGILGSSEGLVYLVVDGGTPTQILAVSNSNTAGIAINSQSIRKWISWQGSGLTPGAHTFSLAYESQSGSSANFSAIFLKVQPV
jgi:hypothetical protein